MAVVLTLVPRRARADTVAVLTAALAMAIPGDVDDFMITYRRDGVEKTVYTGVYWERPAEALRAAMRVSVLLTEIEDEPRWSS